MILSYLPSFMEFIIFYFTAKTFQKNVYKPQKKDFVFCFLITTTIGTIPDSYPVLSVLLGQLLFLSYVLYGCKRDKINSAILYIISFGTIALTQVIICILLALFPVTAPALYMNIIGNVFTWLGVFLLLYFTKLKELYHTITKSSLPFRLIFISMILFFFATILIWKVFPHTQLYTWGLISFVLLVLIALNACILYYDQRTQMHKQELVAYQKNFAIYETLIAEIRATQHAYTNRIQTMENMTHFYSDYDSLCKAISKQATKYREPLQNYPLLQINMKLLAATMYHQHCIARQQQIQIQFNISTTELTSTFREPKIADWICILMQNAIEACHPGDAIYVDLSCQQGKIHFEIRNPVSRKYTNSEISQFFKKNYTTKTNVPKPDGIAHGLGLYSLMQDLKNTSGSIGADCISYDGQFWMIFRLIL